MLKLNIGFNRKKGELNYGSRGASVHLELDYDSALIGDAQRLRDRIRQLFALAKASVDAELAESVPNGRPSTGRNGFVAMPPGTPNDGRVPRRDGTRLATAGQIRALNGLAARHQLDLAALLLERYQLRDPAELRITEAGALIGELKRTGATGAAARG